MCGIVGFITDEAKGGEDARSRFLRQGLIVDTLRGDDSTGCYGVGHEPMFKNPEDLSTMWCKAVSEGYEFVNSDSYVENFWDVSDYRACVGHNRAATVGAVDSAGAHPFVAGPITLVHNGTLTNTHGLPTPMYKLDAVTVDSHAIACNLAEHSVEEVVESLDGAFTLVWHDARDNSMNIIRNTKRPLHMAKSGRQDTIFFASEGPMLDFLGKRLNLDLGPIYFPKEGQHLKWLPTTPLEAPQVKDLDLHAEWSQAGAGYGMHGTYSWDEDDEDWKNDGARRSGNVTVLPTDDRVFVGGRKKAVPMLLQEELLKYDMVVEDRLEFSPQVSTSVEPSRQQVYGWVIMGETRMRAVIFSVLDTTARNMNANWTVRPVAVFVKPSGEPIIIVKLVSNCWVSIVSKVTEHERDSEGFYKMYRGAYGIMYSAREWLTLVAGGCGFCGKPVSLSAHNDITWMNNGAQALCEACSEDEHDTEDFEDDIPYGDDS